MVQEVAVDHRLACEVVRLEPDLRHCVQHVVPVPNLEPPALHVGLVDLGNLEAVHVEVEGVPAGANRVVLVHVAHREGVVVGGLADKGGVVDGAGAAAAAEVEGVSGSGGGGVEVSQVVRLDGGEGSEDGVIGAGVGNDVDGGEITDEDPSSTPAPSTPAPSRPLEQRPPVAEMFAPIHISITHTQPAMCLTLLGMLLRVLYVSLLHP
eukprot:780426-Prorocentrum_minimum.AAC.1